MNELLEFAKEKGIVLLGDYKIEYKGIKMDTANGKTESWTITKRNLPLFEEGVDNNERNKNKAKKHKRTRSDRWNSKGC